MEKLFCNYYFRTKKYENFKWHDPKIRIDADMHSKMNQFIVIIIAKF